MLLNQCAHVLVAGAMKLQGLIHMFSQLRQGVRYIQTSVMTFDMQMTQHLCPPCSRSYNSALKKSSCL